MEVANFVYAMVCNAAAEEVQQRHIQAQPIPYEYVSKDGYSLPFAFLDQGFYLVRYTSATFCVVEKTLHLEYPFSGVNFGTRPLESRRQI